ncbi:alpha-amylase [Oscillochloris sp. ZM17-4]|uniref:alpha-amylase family glycosyl hydrolase n=1 Tax=Oscillochloris sp. ZM17-4 TaxID=2866714 RepID=UPI001C73B13B|nr:alpha-amylase family glycosyl hydrolase [Oscillochloris sp. ZM17-4]MBX0329378.1 alpha-amylase [Oscillochloris sp. ZM17-4]
MIARLDYISDGDPRTTGDLGASCIWLMPIMKAASYHGYDVTDYYTVEPAYGTNDDFRRLVAEADKRGIKVILDLVLNHTSSQHPWFQAALHDPASPYRDYYLWAEQKPPYKGPFGGEAWHKSPVADEYYYGMFWSEMPDLNYRNPAVTAEAEKISAFWLSEMGAAGFRMDAVKHMIEHGAAQADTVETHNWLRGYRQFLQQAAPGSFTIGEIFDGNPSSLAAYYPDQMDMYFEFDVAKQTVGAANLGLASLYMKAVTEAYTKLPFQRWAPFLTNHDQSRAMSVLGDSVPKAKLAALGLLTLPGLPFVYYGEEIGMLGVKPDERIRTPMQWAGDGAGFGFTTGAPWEAPQSDAATKNVAAQTDDPGSLLNAYRALINLHTGTPALATGDFTPLDVQGGVAAFIRQQGDSRALVLINFDSAPVAGVTLGAAASGLPAGTYALTPIYGAPEGEAAALTVGEGGAFTGYAPLAEIPPQTGYIFLITPP